MAQRLVRRLCPHCAETAHPSAAVEKEIAAWLNRDFLSATAAWKKAKGCNQCQQTGYIGRLGIYELVPVTPAMQEAILRREPEQGLWRLALGDGHRTMRVDGLLKARSGLTSIEEILRVVTL